MWQELQWWLRKPAVSGNRQMLQLRGRSWPPYGGVLRSGCSGSAKCLRLVAMYVTYLACRLMSPNSKESVSSPVILARVSFIPTKANHRDRRAYCITSRKISSIVLSAWRRWFEKETIHIMQAFLSYFCSLRVN